MSHSFCAYGGRREELLIAYLYDDIAPDDRAAFERHLASCIACREELETLGAVRADLAGWAPPEMAPMAGIAAAAHRPPRAWWRDMPAWAQVAAAMLFMGAAGAIANVNVTYTHEGISVRTGWYAPVDVAAASERTAAASVAAPGAGAADVVTRAELTAVAESLRAERAAAIPAPASSGDDPAEVLRRVRALIHESEQRQQRELALRVAEVARDVQAQRQADLVRIDRTLGVLQSNTGIAVRRQEQMLNNLAVRVSQRQAR